MRSLIFEPAATPNHRASPSTGTILSHLEHVFCASFIRDFETRLRKSMIQTCCFTMEVCLFCYGFYVMVVCAVSSSQPHIPHPFSSLQPLRPWEKLESWHDFHSVASFSRVSLNTQLYLSISILQHTTLFISGKVVDFLFLIKWHDHSGLLRTALG